MCVLVTCPLQSTFTEKGQLNRERVCAGVFVCSAATICYDDEWRWRGWDWWFVRCCCASLCRQTAQDLRRPWTQVYRNFFQVTDVLLVLLRVPLVSVDADSEDWKKFAVAFTILFRLKWHPACKQSFTVAITNVEQLELLLSFTCKRRQDLLIHCKPYEIGTEFLPRDAMHPRY